MSSGVASSRPCAMCHEMSCFVVVRSPPRPFAPVRGRSFAGHRTSFRSTVPDTPRGGGASLFRACCARAGARVGASAVRARDCPHAPVRVRGAARVHSTGMSCFVMFRFPSPGVRTGSRIVHRASQLPFVAGFLRSPGRGSVPVSRARLRMCARAPPPCAKRRAGRRARLSRPLAPGYLRRPSHRFPAQKSRKATPYAAFPMPIIAQISSSQACSRNYYWNL